MLAVLRQLQRTPFDIAAGNPVFERDIGRQVPAWSQASLQRASRRTQAGAAAVSVAIWLLLWWLSAAGYGAQQPQYIYRASSGVVFWLMLLALSSGLLLDMLAVRAGLPSISDDVGAHRWELLRLTPLRESSIVAGKHAAAQLRVWRALAAVIGLRAATAGLFMVNAFGLSYVFSGVSVFSREELPAVPLVLVTLAVFVVLYVFEPVWRVRAMTALGLAISSYVLSKALATLAAGAALLVVWAVQTVMTAVLLIYLSVVPLSLTMFSEHALVVAAYELGFSLVMIATVAGFHNVVLHWSLRRVHCRISRLVD